MIVFGWAGLILLCGFVISLTFVIMHEFLAAELRPTVALGASAISFLFASDHYLARPHLLTLPIIVVWTVILSRVRIHREVQSAALASAIDDVVGQSTWRVHTWIASGGRVWLGVHTGRRPGALRSDGRPSSAPC
jgi:hypothetical protein